jgi:hypothetical protein
MRTTGRAARNRLHVSDQNGESFISTVGFAATTVAGTIR